MNLNDPATLDRIQAVCDAATAEPWTLDKPECDAEGWAKGVAVAGTPGRQTIYANPPGGSFPRADSVFIALARTFVPLAVAALRERAWRPIEEAPKDGTPVLAFVPSYYQGKGGIIVAVYLHDEWMDNKAWATTPTHFMSLPTPPQQEETP